MGALDEILSARDSGFDGGAYRVHSCESRMASLRVERSFLNLLESVNGFYAFDSSLHVYGCNTEWPFHDIVTRNEHPSRLAYGEDAAGLTFFAEEIFGNQYAFSREGISMFDVESGDKTLLSNDFEGWLRYIAGNTDYATGRPLEMKWAEQYGPIPYGYHLCPKKPFVIGGEYAVQNLYLLSWEQSLSLRADIAHQIRHLPQGTPVVLKTSRTE